MKSILIAVVVTMLAGCSCMETMGYGGGDQGSNMTGANTDVNDRIFRPYHN